MALDTKTFKTRTITAAVFVVVMLSGLLINKWTFIILMAVIHFGCWYEFIGLMRKIHSLHYRSRLALGLFYITLPVLLIMLMRLEPGGSQTDLLLKVIPCGIIFSIWINDTMAYISGSLIGKTPLSVISPKKTVEGTLGGIVLCVLTITVAGYFTPFYPWYHWLAISLITAVAGTAGDLLESKLKRLAGVKDSGSFMPGHGGFLDRFDSLLVAIPFVYVYYFLFIR